MNIIKKILVAVVIVLILFALAGFFIAPAVLKSVLIKNISEVTKRQASIEKIEINPFVFSLTISGFKLAEAGTSAPFVAFDRLHVNAGVMMSVFRRALVLEKIRLEKPYIGITRKTDGTYNFSDLLPAGPAAKEENSKPVLFSLNSIEMTGGRIDFHDLPNKTDHTISEMRLAIPFISNIDYYIKEQVKPHFSALVNGRPLTAAGQTTPFEKSRATSFDINLTDVDVPYYLQYVPMKLNFKLLSAFLDARLKINFLMDPNAASVLTINGQAALKKVALDDLQGARILRLPHLSVDVASIEPLSPKVHLSNVTLDKPELVLKRNKKGEINLAGLVQSSNAGKPATSKANKTKQAASPEPKDSGKTFNLKVDRFLLDKADILFIDDRPARPVKISIAPATLQASNFSLNKGEKSAVDLSLLIDKKTEITAKGTLSITPLTADLALNVGPLALRPFQSYFADSVQLDITRGFVETKGKLTFKMDQHNAPSVKYTGNVAILQLATIDQTRADDFLEFKKLAFTELAADYYPLTVRIKEISLNGFFAKIMINPGGTTNLQDIFSPPNKEPETPRKEPEKGQAKPEAKTAEAPLDIRIGKVNFSDGKVIFADRNIKPNYGATMLNLKGSVTGLSSQEISRAIVDLQGNLGYGSPIAITGTINPLIKDLFADIKVSFKDIEMSSASSYTIKFLGYPVTKGKLTFDVSYLIDHKKLRAENKIFFDQLTFGEKVDSPDAIKAPVTLAVSLLTDRNGQINLDIPLTGSLDDPQFKIWPIIWKILVNLITKAVTSPFALLTSLTGGGEEMSFIEFEPGSAQITDTEHKKIDTLTKALYQRPNIKLDIEGYADPELDKEALKKIQFNNLLKVQKLKDVNSTGQSAATLKDITISRSEYEKYLTLAYKAADIPKPRTALGVPKSQTPQEMEKLLQNHIIVADNDLRQLAESRGQTVRQELLEGGKIEAGRLFLVKPSSLSPEKKDKVKDSRVNFKLK